jgi:hypothetical protein
MFNHKKIKELQQANKDYEEALKKANNSLNEIREKTLASSFSFDFNLTNAFSIERIVRDNIPVTSIGFLFSPDLINSSKREIREWLFCCNEQAHEKLVEDFNQYLEKKIAKDDIRYSYGKIGG